MADGVDFDFSGLLELGATIGRAEVEIVPNVVKAVEVTARHGKDEFRAESGRLNKGHAKHYPNTVTYDMQLDADGVIGAEIGPTLKSRWGQGSLGLIDAPQGTSQKVAKAIAADFEKGILKATEGPL